MNENPQAEERESKPADKWAKYFPEISEEDLRRDIRVKLGKLRNRNRISDGVDLEQLVDFLVWLHRFEDEQPVRFSGKNPFEYLLELISQRSF